VIRLQDGRLAVPREDRGNANAAGRLTDILAGAGVAAVN